MREPRGVVLRITRPGPLERAWRQMPQTLRQVLIWAWEGLCIASVLAVALWYLAIALGWVHIQL
jgi:hypothetical protein